MPATCSPISSNRRVQTLLSAPEGRFNIDRKAALLQATDHPDRLDQIQQYLDAVQNRTTATGADPGEGHRGRAERRVLRRHQLDRADRRPVTRRASRSTWRRAAGSTLTGLERHRLRRLLRLLAEPGQGQRAGEPDGDRDEQRAGDRAGRDARVFFKTTTQRRGDGQDASEDGRTAGVYRRRGAERHAADSGRRHHQHEHHAEHDGAHGSGDVALRRHGADPDVREADTLVRVRENETVVIAGLLDERVQHDVRKVPVLGDLPARSDVSWRDGAATKAIS